MQNFIRSLAFVIVISLPVAQAREFVYVSLAGDQRIAVYALDDASGALTLTSQVDVSGGPGRCASTPAESICLRRSDRSARWRVLKSMTMAR